MNGTAIANRLQNSFKIKDNNLYRSSYYWNFRTSSFKQVACLILKPKNVNRIAKISLGSEPSFIDDFKKAKKGLVKNHSARTKVWSWCFCVDIWRMTFSIMFYMHIYLLDCNLISCLKSNSYYQNILKYIANYLLYSSNLLMKCPQL